MPKNIVIAFFLLLLLSMNSISAVPRMARIIGGRAVDSRDWHWMAGLVFNNAVPSNEVFCGASLVAKDWVLTAGHCVHERTSSSFFVIINQPQLDGGTGESIAVDYVLIHPLYNNITLENDLALIKLATPSSNPAINVLTPFTSQDNAGKPAIALGWGSTSSLSSETIFDLQQVDLPLIDNLRCDIAMGDVTDDMLCAGDGLGERDTCFGDSGGPLIVFDAESKSWRQAGIISWGFGCAEPGFFGVHTRLKNYASFISEHICTAAETPVPVSLNLEINGNIVTANWNAVDNVSGYRLNYAPYPDAQAIYSIDMNDVTDFSVGLGTGSAFYVAMTSYHGNCLSEYSNIESFIIK